MKIVVFNGSPKGDLSITLQYAHYFARLFGIEPSKSAATDVQSLNGHRCTVLNVGQDIGRLRASRADFDDVMSAVAECDLVLWASPVYCLMVPSQLKEFIEMIFEEGAQGPFVGKYAAVIATSTHAGDHFVVRYLNGICDDLGMNYLGAFSAEMFDLLRSPYRQHFEAFAHDIVRSVSAHTPMPCNHAKLRRSAVTYSPSLSGARMPLGHRRMVIFAEDDNGRVSNLSAMVQHFVGCVDGRVDLVSLTSLGIDGGCCGNTAICGYEHHCARSDGFAEAFARHAAACDIVVFAASTHDRFLSAQFTQFLNRCFVAGHVPTFAHKQMAWIISGPLRQLGGVRDFIESVAEFHMANLADVVTDEDDDSTRIDALLESLAGRLAWFAERSFVRPPTQAGIAVAKISRHIVVRNRFLFRADYRFFGKGLGYDLKPNRWLFRVANSILSPLMTIPAFRKFVVARFPKWLVSPFRTLRPT